jgi:hypothetical protein
MWSEQVTAWATLGVAVVGVVQVVITRRAVAVTRDDVREASRARVDALAPRVAYFPVAGLWPPHMDVDYDVTARASLTEDTRLVMPRDEVLTVYLSGAVDLVNEGKSTALVTLPVNAAVVGPGGSVDLPADSGSWEQLRQERVIQVSPGERVRVWVRAGEPLPWWLSEAPAPVTMVITAEDTFTEGVRDVTTVSLQAVPLVPSASRDGSWSLNQAMGGEASRTTVQVSTTRHYRSEGSAHPARRRVGRRRTHPVAPWMRK